MEILGWLEHTVAGEFVFTMLVSMIPVVELRGGLPVGVALGLRPWQALTAGIIGNMIPLPGTGGWTGALAAAFLDMPLRRALPTMLLGVLAAGFLVTGITYGFTSIFA